MDVDLVLLFSQHCCPIPEKMVKNGKNGRKWLKMAENGRPAMIPIITLSRLATVALLLSWLRKTNAQMHR